MASSSSTSFTKKARIKVGQIPGTKPSFHNNQLLVSSGIPSLDNVIGGGIGVGTVMLIEEDRYGTYARLMMKYFAAEAVLTQQSIFLSSVENDQLLKELPAPVDDGTAKPVSKEVDSPTDKMKIAWRYENKPKVEGSSASGVTFGHYYDLTKTMDSDRLAQADIHISTRPLESENLDPLSPIPGMNCRYCHLLQEIRDKVQSGNFGVAQQIQKRNILRIGLHSFGSPLWGEDGSSQSYDPSLALFLTALRALLRSSFAVAVISIPSHLFEDRVHFQRIASLCDTVVRLESFAGSEKEKNPVFKEYHGLFHIVYLPRLNSLIPPQRDTADLAFKLRRKKFTIEKLHLPPELADNASRSQEDDHSLFSKRSTAGCGTSSSSSKLDF